MADMSGPAAPSTKLMTLRRLQGLLLFLLPSHGGTPTHRKRHVGEMAVPTHGRSKLAQHLFPRPAATIYAWIMNRPLCLSVCLSLWHNMTDAATGKAPAPLVSKQEPRAPSSPPLAAREVGLPLLLPHRALLFL